MSKALALRVYQRDGFVDRYSGHRLVFPAALRALSELLPNEFPHHANWRMDACHFAYYELSAGLVEDRAGSSRLMSKGLRNALLMSLTSSNLGCCSAISINHPVMPSHLFSSWSGEASSRAPPG